MIISKDQYNKLPNKYKQYFEPFANSHPCVKPKKLLEYLVNMLTREGQIVLDPFLGSGTTAVACKKLKRKFIGIEREKEYVKIAEARLKSVEDELF